MAEGGRSAKRIHPPRGLVALKTKSAAIPRCTPKYCATVYSDASRHPVPTTHFTTTARRLLIGCR